MRGAGTTLAALGYVLWRETLRRLHRLVRNPVAVVVGLVLVASSAVVFLAGPDGGPMPEIGAGSHRGFVGFFASFLVAVCWNAAAVCPIRLRGPDLSWLVPRPGADRALVGWHIVVISLRIAVFGLAGVTLAAVFGSGTVVWPLVAFVAGFALVRGLPALVHLVAIRRAPRTVAAVVRLTTVAVAIPPLADAFDRTGNWVERLHTVTRPAEEVLDALVAAVIAPDPSLTALGWAGAVTAVVVATAVALGTGWENGAALRTWEFESLTAAVRDGSMTGELMAEAIARQVRPGVATLESGLGLRGEWALVWRAVAAWRRSWRPIGIVAGAGFATAALLAGLAPQAAALPVVLIGAVTVVSPQTGMLEEADHLALYRIPGRPLAKVVAVDLVPIVAVSATLVLVAVPWLVVADLPADTVVAGLAALPLVMAGIVAVGGTASLWGSTVARRLGLSVAGGVACGVVLASAGAAASAAGSSPLTGVVVAAPVVAIAAWSASSRLVHAGR